MTNRLQHEPNLCTTGDHIECFRSCGNEFDWYSGWVKHRNGGKQPLRRANEYLGDQQRLAASCQLCEHAHLTMDRSQ